MLPSPDERRMAFQALATLRPQWIELLGDMDRAYAAAAAGYGFQCRGCEDNCCRSLFYHHTALEYGYLAEGFAELPQPVRTAIRQRAATASAETAGPDRPMCPLNIDQRCSLYPHRPMICRLHGIPHELHPPGNPSAGGPGCDAFTRSCGHRPAAPLDRTPLYRRMALLEQGLRRSAGLTRKFKATVAEMILTF